jgi:hypothetical protein
MRLSYSWPIFHSLDLNRLKKLHAPGPGVIALGSSNLGLCANFLDLLSSNLANK